MLSLRCAVVFIFLVGTTAFALFFKIFEFDNNETQTYQMLTEE